MESPLRNRTHAGRKCIDDSHDPACEDTDGILARLDASSPAALASPALGASLALLHDAAQSHAAPAADWAEPSMSYRNDTTDVGYVMDPRASDWQDMVWVDPD